jgi:hypothetical protein
MGMDLAQVRQAAAERKQVRRLEPVNARKAAHTALLEGRPDPGVVNNWSGPEFNPPETLGEWLDDRLTERTWLYGMPDTAVLFAIAEAAREGRAAAVAAVRQARKLTPRQQYVVRSVLAAWRTTRFLEADALMAAVIAEWRRLKLADKQLDAG